MNLLIIFLLTTFGMIYGQNNWVITAESLSGNLKDKSFIYSGAVKVTSNQATIYCDKLIGELDEKEEIKDLVAIGSVKVIGNNGAEVTGEKATYDRRRRILIITGNPKIIKDKNSLLAREITYHLDTDTFEASGSVETVIYEETQTK